MSKAVVRVTPRPGDSKFNVRLFGTGPGMYKVVDYARFPESRVKEQPAMRKTAIRFSLVVLAALAIMAVSANAQAPDFSKVQIKTNKVSNNFYTLDGQGGTIGVLAGPEGVFMVDGQFAPLTDKIVAAIKQITNAPIKYMVNTHVHGDHTGGNENFGKLGVTILSRGSLRNRLMHPAPAAVTAWR